MRTTREFLAGEIYLPDCILLANIDVTGDRGFVDFLLNEPQITRGPLSTYLTLRGLHICISQATYALFEELINQGKISEINIPTLRQYASEGRLKITELYQKFRREVSLAERLQGVVELTKLRFGKLPIIKFGFDFGNGGIHGDLVSVIVPFPVQQTNVDIIRVKPSEPKAGEK